MADEAILDAPVLDTDVDTSYADIDVNATSDTDTADTNLDTSADATAEVKGDGRKLPAEIRALKETDPAAYKKAKSEFFADLADKETFGKDAEQIRSFLEEKGGLEGISRSIEDLQNKAAELDSINQAVSEGKIEVLDRVPTESVPALASAMNQKWAEADPEGWGKAMSGIMAATIQNSGIPSFLNEMAMMLKYNDTESFGARLQQLQEWARSFQKQAAAPVTPKQATKGPDVNQERQQWETEKFTTVLTQEVEKAREQQISAALQTYISRKPNDSVARALAVKNVRQEVLERLNADKDFTSKVSALVARKDKDGAMRLIKARESKAIEEIAPNIGRTIFGQPAVVKPAPVIKKPTPVPAVKSDPRDAIFARALAR